MKNEKWATAETLTRNAEQVSAVAHFSFLVFHFSFFIFSFFFPQQKSRPPLHLFINPPDVFGYDAQAKKYEAIKKSDQGNDGRPTGDGKAKQFTFCKKTGINQYGDGQEAEQRNAQT